MTTKQLVLITTSTSLLAVCLVQFVLAPAVNRYKDLLETEQAYTDLCKRLAEDNLRSITIPREHPKSFAAQR